MSEKFSLVTLDIEALVFSMAETREKANMLIDVFLEEKEIDCTRKFLFDFVMKKDKVSNTLFLAYAEVPMGTKGSKDLKIIELKNHNYVHVRLSESEYQDLILGELDLNVGEYLKNNGLKIDISKVYGLVEVVNNCYNMYVPYKL